MKAIMRMKAGGIFYHSFGRRILCKQTGMRKTFYSKIYVIEVNRDKELVLASINGLPAAWYAAKHYSRWKSEPPINGIPNKPKQEL